ncbi:GGDEF domain-containing protein [Sphingobium sp. H39-3-25]|uniref:GGDEF domain-containing protein n=1 Tax=Sphingobium arseniciresistens TaxID=3030834 RepID=UPI0023B9827E|nr:GGDEF domain-containing protein [Sphingobium arseniciresistens]
MPAPDAEIERLTDLANKNPTAALAETAHDRVGRVTNWSKAGWRQAVRAEAYDILSQAADSRRVALDGLRQTRDKASPLYVELLVRYAGNGSRENEIRETMPLILAARQLQKKGTAADICLQMVLGEMQRMQDVPDMAIINLTEAYRASATPRFHRQHILVADQLARLMGWAGDYSQAISLINEVADQHRRMEQDYSLATDLFFRGRFLVDKGEYRAAIADFEKVRTLGAATDDPVGSAFVDMLICEALVELRKTSKAEGLCRRAEAMFQRHHDEEAAGDASLLLARIALTRRQPAISLSRLNHILSSGYASPASVSTVQAYKLRAEANRQLGNTAAAYTDLADYVRLTGNREKTEQTKRSAVLRARFEADKAISKNRALARELHFAGEREQEQNRRYTVLWLSGAIAFNLLFIIVIMGIVHRRKLTRIANTDTLTGLINRRSAITLATPLISAPAMDGVPLILALLDLDHFKRINDTYGHGVGDEVLRCFADTARDVLRKTDIIARWGGEEFLIIFPSTSLASAIATLAKLREVMAQARTSAGNDLHISFSAGLTRCSPGQDLESLVTAADAALYRAKRQGRDRTIIASDRMLRSKVAEARLERREHAAA